MNHFRTEATDIRARACHSQRKYEMIDNSFIDGKILYKKRKHVTEVGRL